MWRPSCICIDPPRAIDESIAVSHTTVFVREKDQPVQRPPPVSGCFFISFTFQPGKLLHLFTPLWKTSGYTNLLFLFLESAVPNRFISLFSPSCVYGSREINEKTGNGSICTILTIRRCTFGGQTALSGLTGPVGCPYSLRS